MVLRQFLRGAFIFAGSAMLFSFVRQLLAFPALANFSEVDFALITTSVFLLEAVAYGFTGAIPDYFTRNAVNGVADGDLFYSLEKILLLSVFVWPIFILFGLDFTVSFFLTIYLYCFSLNALYIKLHFNVLDFKENYYYVAFRVIPYMLLYVYALSNNSIFASEELLLVFILLLLLFEFLYHLRVRANNCISGMSRGGVLKYIWPFMIGYLLIGLVQRGDLVLFSKLNEQFYIEYAKNIIVISFFCNPIVLVISNPLLSYLSRHDVKVDSKELIKIIVFSAIFMMGVALVASVVFGLIYKAVYGDKTSFSLELIFFLVFFTVQYNLMRTLCVKYVASDLLIKGNLATIFVVVVGALSLKIISAVFLFYSCRSLTLLVCFFVARGKGENPPKSCFL